MKCPSCSAALQEERTSSYRVFVCSDCQGMWFDPGEAISYAKVLAASRGEPVHYDFSSRMNPLNPLKQEAREGHRPCPRCSVGLDLVNYAYNSNVFVEKCPQCEGLWTDKGEASILVQYVAGSEAARERGEILVDAFVHKPSRLGPWHGPIAMGALLSYVAASWWADPNLSGLVQGAWEMLGPMIFLLLSYGSGWLGTFLPFMRIWDMHSGNPVMRFFLSLTGWVFLAYQYWELWWYWSHGLRGGAYHF